MDEYYKNKWNEFVEKSREAIEDFNDFHEDRLIVWADNRIKELEKIIEEGK